MDTLFVGVLAFAIGIAVAVWSRRPRVPAWVEDPRDQLALIHILRPLQSLREGNVEHAIDRLEWALRMELDHCARISRDFPAHHLTRRFRELVGEAFDEQEAHFPGFEGCSVEPDEDSTAEWVAECAERNREKAEALAALRQKVRDDVTYPW